LGTREGVVVSLALGDDDVDDGDDHDDDGDEDDDKNVNQEKN
jgi:hypothetical protein